MASDPPQGRLNVGDGLGNQGYDWDATHATTSGRPRAWKLRQSFRKQAAIGDRAEDRPRVCGEGST
jgi:hypothetical protein